LDDLQWSYVHFHFHLNWVIGTAKCSGYLGTWAHRDQHWKPLYLLTNTF